jgi:phosphoribosylamine--glycine ligase
MNILLIGSGGREHAIALALAKSPRLEKLFLAPGNPGMAALGETVRLDLADHASVASFCKLMRIDLVVIGPEAPLVAGLVDDLSRAGIAAFGPSKAAARLEGSKSFTKDFCARHKIPTARYAVFTKAEEAKAYAREKGAPIVVKADGLAAGKGVIVATTIAEAEEAIDRIFAGAFGGTGEKIVIEEFLDGEEASFFALCDGKTALGFSSAQDHKRAFDGERGPNTGGMGAISPARGLDEDRVMREIIKPTLQGMEEEGAPFKGVLYAGLMIGASGPKLIEFNVRFGDPEAQVILPRLEDDLVALIEAAVAQKLGTKTPRFSPLAALCVVLAAKGYPDAPLKGTEIKGLEKVQALPFVTITHAGTKRAGGKLLADGGRVLNVTALGADMAEARDRAYAAVDVIDWPEGFCRRDIGWRALARA